MERKPDEDEGQGGWLYKLCEMVAGYLSGILATTQRTKHLIIT